MARSSESSRLQVSTPCRSTRVVFTGSVSGIEPIGRLPWLGTDCPVPASMFPHTRSATTEGKGLEFLFLVFPSAGPVLFLQSPFDAVAMARPVQEGVDGIVIHLH